ncbi:MAG: hypothetical protein Q9160_002755 [Pyrenula sp. 1 TL-2023]
MSAGTPNTEDRNTCANLGPEETRSRAISPNAPSTEVELANVQNGVPKETTGGEDLMQYARLGDIGAIQKLFENKRFDARYKDEEGITPLHISRNQTTFENMTRHSIEHNLLNPSSRALTSAMTTGSTSFEAGGLSSTGMGPNPVTANPHPGRWRKEGCLAQWKKLLGLDAFMATASDGLAEGGRQRSRQNLFSRGVITNCKDFFCDPSPYFGVRSSGNGMLGGEIINYSQLYDVPLRTGAGRTGGMVYRSVAGDDPLGEDAV